MMFRRGGGPEKRLGDQPTQHPTTPVYAHLKPTEGNDECTADASGAAASDATERRSVVFWMARNDAPLFVHLAIFLHPRFRRLSPVARSRSIYRLRSRGARTE